MARSGEDEGSDHVSATRHRWRTKCDSDLSARRRSDPRPDRVAAMSLIKRFSPLAILLLAVVAAFTLGLHEYLSFEQLERNRAWLLDLVHRHAVLAPFAFMLIYAIAIALSIPGGAILTMAGGFLFGIAAATVYAVVAATLGATIVFLIAKTAFGNTLRQRAGPAMRRMETGFRENALNYLLVLRLIPVFPFWLVNLVSAFLGVPLRTYVMATAVGIIPGTLVYASIGNGLGAVFEAGGRPDLGIIFESEIILPIIGLAALALLPVAYRKIKARQPS
jgi:uncharacterized membrane protein YdjX (TVP38/TMEM64 family)